MNRADRLARTNIIKLTPYSSARDEYQGKKGIFLDANENPYGTINRYPDPYHRELKKEVSRLKGIPEEMIFFGNGSDEIIDLVFRIFCNPGSDKALTFTPTYGMYEVTASVNDITMIKIPLDNNFDIDISKAESFLEDENIKLIFICSPNNPTGNSPSGSAVASLIERFRGIVVIDEAYIDFSRKPSFLPLIKSHDNLVVMQTFSKAWGAAAARTGMAFADPSIIRYLYRVKPPYNISTLNQKAVMKRLENPQRQRKQVSAIISERERIRKRLPELAIVNRVYESDANFLLVKVSDANLIYNLLTDKNIIVRNRSSVIGNCLRITIGTKKENDILLNELRKISI